MEFGHIGAKCSFPGCNLKDFLPFDCDACKRAFCLDHRSYRAHSCTKSGAKDHRVFACPLCASSLKCEEGVDPNETFARHQRSVCDPSKADKGKKKKKPKCPIPGCRERLTASNTFHCTKCRQNVCLKHRFGADHSCPGRPVRGLGAKGFNSTTTAKKVPSSTTADKPKMKSTKTTAKSQGKHNNKSADIRSLLRATAHRRGGREAAPAPTPTRVSVNVPAPSLPTAATTAPSTSSTSNARAREACPHCRARFVDVMDLVSHVETAHGSAPSSASAAPAVVDLTGDTSSSSSSSSGGAEVCPTCNQRFPDVMALIAHSEVAHGTEGSKGSSYCPVS